MQTFETATAFELYDPEVVVAGDWHGDVGWVGSALAAVRRAGVSTVLHVGDFGLWDERFFTAVDYAARRAPGSTIVERILVTPGNHEHYGKLQPLFDASPGMAIRLSEVVWALPRGFRFTVGEQRVLSVGGAPSVDYGWRSAGVDWWPDEALRDEDVERAVAGGRADVLIAHDTVNGSGVLAVERLLWSNPHEWPRPALAYAAAGREKLTRIWDAVDPPIMFHGHYHVRDSAWRSDLDRRVESLDMNGKRGNLVLFDTLTRDTQSLPVKGERD